ncbi:Virus attachment protein p12 family protein [Clostridium sp. USBA 49]|jgi:ferrous iron transport protein B|nr:MULTISPECIES: FeoB-associated Cys-rich membrane protein [Clostridium]SKA74991.1 Virus attachment protein p12 family protein [Clostridium sp. USBA 49]
MEIIITILLLALAIFIFYKNFKKSTKGECNCGSCSSSCPMYNKEKNKK